jgi:hypothetical protein
MLEALKNLIYRVSAHQFAHTDGTPNEIAAASIRGKAKANYALPTSKPPRKRSSRQKRSNPTRPERIGASKRQ